jgi:pimeloyl-ACP methyl ester carboxylesterase
MNSTVTNRQGERLDLTYHPGRAGDARLVVIGHGVTANKDRAFLVSLADALAAAGTAALRFSFSGNGASEGRFEDSTVSKEVADLSCVLDACAQRELVYAGHSMGGAVGVLAAAADARIRKLVSLAGMVHTAAFARRKFGALVPGRDTMWEKPECPLSQAFVDDMQGIGSVLPQAAQVRVPWLLVHGDADTVVPLQDSRDALAATPAPAELIVLEGCDHVFSDGADREMAAAVVRWLVG